MLIEEISKSDVFKNTISINKLDNVSEDGFVYSLTKDKIFFNKGIDFLNSIWSTNLNQTSDLININDERYILLQVQKENKKQGLIFEL